MKKMHASSTLLPLAYALLSVAGLGSFAAAAQPLPTLQQAWRQVNIAGDDYVSLAELMSFYKLERHAEKDSIISYDSPQLSLVFDESRPFIAIDGVAIKLLRPLLRDGSGERLIAKTDCIHLLDPILRPSYITPHWTLRRVIIDPAHGGAFTGVRTSEEQEKSQLMLSVAKQLASLLQAQGFEVSITREDDYYVDPQERVDSANAQTDCLFIRLRVDDCAESEAGISCYIAEPDPQREVDGLNAALGMAMQSYLTKGTGLRDSGLRRVKHDLLAGLRVPAVMLVLGNIAHQQNRSDLHDAAIQSALAKAMQAAINAFAVAVAAPEPVPEPEPETVPEQEAAAEPTAESQAPLDEVQAVLPEDLDEVQAVEVE